MTEIPAHEAPSVPMASYVEPDDRSPSEALDDVPLVFRLPASKASLAQNQFRFQLPGEDHVRSMPKLKYLKPGVAMRIGTMELQEAVIELLTMYHPDLLDKMEGMDQIEPLVEAWAKASGIALGESSPS